MRNSPSKEKQITTPHSPDKNIEKDDKGELSKGMASFAGCSINLLKSIIGSGMLVLPSSFAAFGALPAILLLSVAAILSITGLRLLVLASDRLVTTGRATPRNINFTELAKPTLPKLSLLFEAVVAIKCLTVCASYMTVAGDTLISLSKTLFPAWPAFFTSRLFWVTVSFLLVAPVTFFHKMDGLKYTSFAGLGGIGYLFILSIIMFFSYNTSFTESISNIKLFVPFTFKSLTSFSTFVFALTCHQNIFPIYNEIKDNRPKTLFNLITICIGSSCLLYTIFAVSFLGVFGIGVTPNVINSLPHGTPYEIARLLYALLMVFSFPLQAFPARASLVRLFSAFASKELSSPLKRLIIHISFTVAILLSTWALAVSNPGLDKLIGFVGCTAGPIVCYFLPAAFWLKLEEAKPWNKGKFAAWSLIVFGTLATVIPLFALTWSIFSA